MKTEEFEQLEKLISNLSREVGYDVTITNGVIQDGYHIACYGQDGIRIDLLCKSAYSIQDAVRQIHEERAKQLLPSPPKD